MFRSVRKNPIPIYVTRICYLRVCRLFLSSNTGKPSFRRLLPLLIKRVHPDLYGSYSQDVRDRNMRCTQTLNEFWDSFEAILSDHSSSIHTTEIRAPLNEVYVLSCSLKEKCDEDLAVRSTNRLHGVTFILKPPLPLRRRMVIAKNTANVALSTICRDLGKLFLLFGIEGEWITFLASEGISTVVSKTDDIFGDDSMSSSHGDLQETIEKKLLEKIANIYANRARVSLFADNRNVSSLSDEVNAYIRRGNVLLKDMKVEDEISVVKKFRDTLIDFGHTVNFRLSTWWCVVLIFAPGQAYSIQKASERYIVKVPSDFKAKQLLRSLRTNLPMADLTYEDDYDIRLKK